MNQPWPRVDVFAKDRNSQLLSGADFRCHVAGRLAGEVQNSTGHASFEFEDRTDGLELSATYDGATQETKLALDQDIWIFTFPVTIDRSLRILVRDRQGNPIPGASVVIAEDGLERRRTTDNGGLVEEVIHDPRVEPTISAEYKNRRCQKTSSRTQQQIEFDLDAVYVPMDTHRLHLVVGICLAPIAIAAVLGYANGMDHLALIIGLVLAAVATFLAFAFSAVTPLQRQIILTLAALAGGAIATEIPGFLNVNLSLGEKTGVAASGAIAVFVILYFWSARKPPD